MGYSHIENSKLTENEKIHNQNIEPTRCDDIHRELKNYINQTQVSKTLITDKEYDSESR